MDSLLFVRDNSMCAIVLDTLVLMGLVMALNQDESPGMFKAAMSGLAISLLGGGALYGLLQVSAVLALIAVPFIMAAAAGFVLWVVFDTPPVKAAIGGGIFVVYKIALGVVFAFLMSTPGQ